MSHSQSGQKGWRRKPLAFSVWGCVGVAATWFAACRAEPAPGEREVARGKELLPSQPEKALEEFQAAETLNAPGALLGLALAQERLGQLAEAEQSLQKLLAAEPANLEAKLSLARVRIALGKLDEARDDLQGTLGSTPPHVPSILLFAALVDTNERATAAATALDALKTDTYAVFRESAEYAVAQAVVAAARGDAEAAKKRLDGAQAARSMSPQLAVALADSLKLARRAREAEWLLERAAANPAAPDMVHESLAAVAMDLGHLSLAQKAISELRTDFKPDPKALLLAARLYDLQRDPKRSAEASGRAVEALPSNVSVAERQRIQLAHVDALIRAKQTADAETALRAMLKEYPELASAKLILSGVLLAQNKAAEAIALVKPLLGEAGRADQAYPLLVAAHRQLAQSDEAVRVAREFVEKSKGATPAVTLLAQVLASTNQKDEALRVIDGALATKPNDLALAHTRVDLLEKTSGAAAARAAVDRLAQNADARLRLLAARWYAKLGNDARALEVLKKLAQEAPKDTQVLAELAAAETRLGQLAEAAASLAKLVEAVPFDTGALIALGSLQSKLGQAEQARRSYEAALQVEPDSVVPLNNLAALLTDVDGQGERAIELARRARALAGNDAAVADTLGWALATRGGPKHLDEALSILHSSSKQLRSAEGYYHYGMALKRAGKKAEAKVELTRALEAPGSTKWVDAARTALGELR